MRQEASDNISTTLERHYEEVSTKLCADLKGKKQPSIFKTVKVMLLSLKQRAKTIDEEISACMGDAEMKLNEIRTKQHDDKREIGKKT
jgi:hypothetical protein